MTEDLCLCFGHCQGVSAPKISHTMLYFASKRREVPLPPPPPAIFGPILPCREGNSHASPPPVVRTGCSRERWTRCRARRPPHLPFLGYGTASGALSVVIWVRVPMQGMCGVILVPGRDQLILYNTCVSCFMPTRAHLPASDPPAAV